MVVTLCFVLRFFSPYQEAYSAPQVTCIQSELREAMATKEACLHDPMVDCTARLFPIDGVIILDMVRIDTRIPKPIVNWGKQS